MSINLYKFIQIYPDGIAYNPDAKEDFKNIGQKFLKDLVKDPEVINHEIGYNKGGIAVSGDHSVKLKYRNGEWVHLFFNMDLMRITSGICFRRCSGPKDHTGERNNYIPWEKATSPGEIQGILREFVYGREYAASL